MGKAGKPEQEKDFDIHFSCSVILARIDVFISFGGGYLYLVLSS